MVTHGGIDKLQVYQGLGVQEVWFWEQGRFQLYALEQGEYVTLEARSRLLPELDFGQLSQFVGYRNQTQAAIAYRDILNP